MLSRRIRRVTSVLLIAIILTVGFVPCAFANVAAKVNVSSARVFKSASTKSQSLRVGKGLSVSITAISSSGSWARVTRNGRTAYIPLKWLSPTSKTKAYATKSAAVYGSNLKKIGSVSRGTGVYVLGTIGSYYLVMSTAGRIGYVKSGVLSASKPSSGGSSGGGSSSGGSSGGGSYNGSWTIGGSESDTASANVEKAISVALSMVGRPYSSNANPPKSFDCSIFVWYCMGQGGIDMKANSAKQAADGRYALITDLSDLRRGDVLCFATSGGKNVDHTAIYLGSGKFVEASQTAKKVHVNTFSEYYVTHFVCARRP